MNSVHPEKEFKFFEWALHYPNILNQKLVVWKQMWHDVVDDAPDTLHSSLAASDHKLFPNMILCLYLLMVVPLSTAPTEHSHSGLQIDKSKPQSTMGQLTINALMLFYIHKHIQINYAKIDNIYPSIYPRRMVFKNPLAEEQ